ncbi:hypothetical protein ACIBG6_36240 [Streptomyces sp. NPDC050842]|uniref:hypothetical protein n=1 Tax=Streptomyces sp. NPDC050842 TaxID=3365636 RepID=UPI00379D5250
MARQTRPLAEHYGDLVRVSLMEARPAGLQTRQLVSATRLTKSQVARGVRHLRDVGAAEHLTPIIWRRRDGYMFSEDPADWIEYEKKQFQQILSRLTRMITGRSTRTWPATPTTSGPSSPPPSSLASARRWPSSPGSPTSNSLTSP